MEPDIAQDVNENEELQIVELEMKASDIKRYYSALGNLDIRDVVIFIRSKHPNPWQKVIVESDVSLPVNDLEGMRIYVKGRNSDNARTITGLGNSIYCPVQISSTGTYEDGFGILEKLAEYSTTYQLDTFEVLVYGEDNEALRGAWEYLQGRSDITQRVYFPPSFMEGIKLFDDGIDIAPYAKKLAEASNRNELTSAFLVSVLDELREQVRGGKIRIQDFEDTRSIYAKWITLCLTQEFSLPPVYLNSYIAEYVGLKVAYPFEKLSFYERLQFLRSLPENIGYIPQNQEIACVFRVVKKVYPHPYMAFNLNTGEVITQGLKELYDLEHMAIEDYRNLFTESTSVFAGPGTTSLAAGSQQTDADVDARLVNIFTRVTEASPDKNIYLSIRNTAIVKVAGENHLLYFTEPFGVGGVLQSPYIGTHGVVIGEDGFHRLIDVKVILADQKRQSAPTPAQGQQVFTQIMTLNTQFRPAIDTFTLMCSELSKYLASDLSYYDRRLRCDKCILPIVTHVDSALSSKKSVFDGSSAEDHIDLINLRYDKIGGKAVTAFGGLNSDLGYYDRVPVSIDTFRGCRLL